MLISLKSVWENDTWLKMLHIKSNTKFWPCKMDGMTNNDWLASKPPDWPADWPDKDNWL